MIFVTILFVVDITTVVKNQGKRRFIHWKLPNIFNSSARFFKTYYRWLDKKKYICLREKNCVTPNTWLPDLTSGTCFRNESKIWKIFSRVYDNKTSCIFFVTSQPAFGLGAIITKCSRFTWHRKIHAK